jgi:hypothetical protein
VSETRVRNQRLSAPGDLVIAVNTTVPKPSGATPRLGVDFRRGFRTAAAFLPALRIVAATGAVQWTGPQETRVRRHAVASGHGRGPDRPGIRANARAHLTLREPRLFAPAQPGFTSLPVMRIAISQVGGWWLFRSDERGKQQAHAVAG